jgi:hypothetical protein
MRAQENSEMATVSSPEGPMSTVEKIGAVFDQRSKLRTIVVRIREQVREELLDPDRLQSAW